MTSDGGGNIASDSGLKFVNDLNVVGEADAIFVRIPRGVRSKQALLAEYQRQLQLPGHFGWNWDALEDCLRDLTWLPPSRPIVVLHDSLPLPRGRRNRPTT